MSDHTVPAYFQDNPATPPLTSGPMSPSRRLHSRSTPASPSQQPLVDYGHHRSPSLSRTTTKPSPSSESTPLLPPPRKGQGGCKYETGMARARRRIPYSMGPEKLAPEPIKARKQLSAEQEVQLSKDIQTFYEQQLLPTEDSQTRRKQFVGKLETILRGRWPESNIKVNVFGSTETNLGTSDSDVDVCVTTDSTEMSRVCSIADLLANSGMKRVVCVSSAKVPIVKLWDPELKVACDLNVNNPIALENTAMIRSYVALDRRVRPLAMMIKYWAKRRILNDAALGGTLSSYTWICLTLNFLQTRKPPILPSLQQQPHVQPQLLGGVDVSFDKNLDSYRDFGTANTDSLGHLLIQFFHYYGFEFNFEQHVVSVRTGRTLSKKEKNWNMLQDNRLCVEEPFNTSRNLANTADDTSMRGIHLELRRAFSLIADGQLVKCCEQYEYPPDEHKPTSKFVPPISRPVIAQVAPASAVASGKQNSRGGKVLQSGRNQAGNSRRSSNAAARNQSGLHLRNLPFQMTTQELQLQQQHQQHLLHDSLFQQYQFLQMQEQELRARLQQQRQRGLAADHRTQSGAFATQDENGSASINAGFASIGRMPMSAPLYQQRFGASPYLHPVVPVNGISTNPSSPHLSPALPDTRRFSRRTSLTHATNGTSLRAQSQPARAFGVPMSLSSSQSGMDTNDYVAGRRSSNASGSYASQSATSARSYIDFHRRPAEYVGYYVGQSPPLYGHPQSTSISPVPSHVGLAIQNGGLSPRSTTTLPHQSHIGNVAMLPPLAPASVQSDQQNAKPEERLETGPAEQPRVSSKVPKSAANGPAHVSAVRSAGPAKFENEDPLTFSASTSEDLAFDTPSSSRENSPNPGANGTARAGLASSDRLAQSRTSIVDEPLVNGRPQQKEAQESKSTVLPYPLGRQLSAVQEARTPSPTIERGHRSTFSAGSIRSQVMLPVGKETKSHSASSSPAIGTPSPDNQRDLGLGMSGPDVPEPSGSSWQIPKAKRKHRKKVTKSENDASGSPGRVDHIPAKDSERKGG